MNTALWPMTLLMATLALLCMAGCHLAENTHYRHEARYYANRNVIGDAQESYRQHDLRIFMIQGNGNGFPGGLSQQESARLAQRYGTKIMNLGSDAISSVAEGNYREAQAKYAAEYNREMARLLAAHRLDR